MSNMVTRINNRVRCEIYPCKERAEIAIGPEGRKQLCFYVCKEHAKQIRDGLNELIPEEETAPLEVPEETPETEDTTGEEFATPEVVGEAHSKEEGDGEEVDVPDFDEAAPVDMIEETPTGEPTPSAIEVYTCKHCNETFPKNKEGLGKYKGHMMNCPMKPQK